MRLRQFKTFIALAEELSFKKAAERLNLTQPPVSQQLNALEQDLGVRLLNRGRNRKISLTTAGKIFLDRARIAVRAADQAAESVKLFGVDQELFLRIAATEEFHHSPLAGALADFTRARPKARFSFDASGHNSSLLDAVGSGRVDIALITFPVRDKYPRLAFTEIARCPIAAVVHASHPLAGRSQIWLNELEDEPLYILSESPETGFSVIFSRLFAAASHKTGILGYSSSSIMMARFAQQSMGSALVCRWALPLRVDDVSIIELKDKSAYISLGIAHDPEMNNEAVGQVIDMIRTAFA